MKVAMLLFALLTAACAQPEPVRRPVQVRVEADPGAAGETMVSVCDGRNCTLLPDVLLDERDLRGVQMQDGEVQALVLLEFTSQGAEKLRLVTRSNVGRRLAFVQDGRVLATVLVQQEVAGGKAQLTGTREQMRLVYDSLTQPTPRAPVTVEPAGPPTPLPEAPTPTGGVRK